MNREKQQTVAGAAPLLGALAAIALMLAGCNSQPSAPDSLTYAAHLIPDDEFAAGTGRAPTYQTLYRLGKLLVAQDKDVQAERAFRSCIGQFPNFMPAYNELADLYVRHHRFDTARTMLATGLAIDEDDPVLRNNLGMCNFLCERYDEALIDFSRAADRVPGDTLYLGNKALTLGMLGRYDESMAVYTDISSVSSAHFNLGVICEARGDYERATNEFSLANDLHEY